LRLLAAASECRRVKNPCTALCFILAAAAFGAAPREKPIGVFDSGTGGLTVLEAMIALDGFDNRTGLPGGDGVPDFSGEAYQYLADQANMPYGNYPAAGKTDLLREHILKGRDFLLGASYETQAEAGRAERAKPPVKMIVIACNTATAYGLDALKDSGVPVIGVINAGVKAAMERQKRHPGTIGILATAGTVASKGYPNAIQAAARRLGIAEPSVASQGAVGLAESIDRDWNYLSDAATAVRTEYKGPSLTSKELPIDPSLLPVYNFDAEKNRLLRRFDESGECVEMQLNDPANYVRYHLVALLETVRRQRRAKPLNTLVLACTHYPYVRDTIAAVLEELRTRRYRDVLAPQVELIDPAVETAKDAYLEMRGRGLQRAGGAAPPDAFFISVPNTSLAEVRLQPDGWFTYDYKYGRTAGAGKEYVRYVPFDAENVSGETYRRIRATLPGVSERLSAQRPGR
jgi:glutamate racemase